MIPSDDESEVDVPDTLVVASPEAASDRPTDADIADSLAKAADGIEVPEGALQESDLQELPQPGPSQECSNLNELPQPGPSEECSNPKELPQPGPSEECSNPKELPQPGPSEECGLKELPQPGPSEECDPKKPVRCEEEAAPLNNECRTEVDAHSTADHVDAAKDSESLDVLSFQAGVQYCVYESSHAHHV